MRVKDVLVSENDKALFYANDFTMNLTKYARKPDIHDISLDGWYVLLVELKEDKSKEYILINKEGEFVYSNTSFESIACNIDVFKALRRMEE